jgi:hypothetical protein
MASLKLKHVDVVEGMVDQDAREVNTKFAKSFTTWCFPVPAEVRHLAGAGPINRDHVHMLLSIPASLAVSRAVQYLKGRSSHKLLSEFQSLRKRYWGQHLWAKGLLGLSGGVFTNSFSSASLPTRRSSAPMRAPCGLHDFSGNHVAVGGAGLVVLGDPLCGSGSARCRGAWRAHAESCRPGTPAPPGA